MARWTRHSLPRISLLLLLTACSTGRQDANVALAERAPLTSPDDLADPTSAFEKHPFWIEPEPREQPSGLGSPRFAPTPDGVDKPDAYWSTDVPLETPLTLWPGADPVPSCFYEGQILHAWDRKEVRYRIEGAAYVYYPTAPWTKPALMQAIEDTILYSDETSTPFALLPKGTRFEVVEETSEAGQKPTPGVARVCIDPPVCSLRGKVDADRVGQAHFHSDKDPFTLADTLPEESAPIDHYTNAPIELFDRHGRSILKPFIPFEYTLIRKTDKLAEVVVPYSIQRGHSRTSVYLYGFIDANLVPEQDPDNLRGRGTGGFGYGRFVSHRPRTFHYLQKGAWVYGEPDEKTRFAQVRADWVKLWARKVKSTPRGWVAVSVDTPWGFLPAFIPLTQAHDSLPEGVTPTEWDPLLHNAPCGKEEE